MTAAKISHYYSSTDEEPTPSPPMHTHKKAGTSTAIATKKPILEEKDVDSDAKSNDIVVTKEVHSSKSRTLQQMAQLAKRQPGLRGTTA